MTRLLGLLVLLFVGSAVAQGPGGYQLKYKSIPPKPKEKPSYMVEAVEPARPITRSRPQPPSTPAQLARFEVEWDRKAAQSERYTEVMTAKVVWRAQQWESARVAYNAQVDRNNELVGIYEDSRAASEGALEANWELERRAQNYDYWLRRYERPVVVVDDWSR